MKFMFVEAKSNIKIVLPKKVVDALPDKVGLFFTLQFIDSLKDIKKQLEDSGRIVKTRKGKHTRYEGQMYGCNLEKFEDVDALLYIGDGLFHPKALILGNNLPVHIWNPVSKEHKVFDRKLMQDELKRQKGAYLKFLSSKKIGVLISTKPGQSYLKYAFGIEKKYPDKEFFYIANDNIALDSLEDFPFIEVWVNTACPRLGWDDTKRASRPMLDLGTVL